LRKATLRLLGRKRAGSISSSSGRTAAPIATSKGVVGSAWKNPALTTGRVGLQGRDQVAEPVRGQARPGVGDGDDRAPRRLDGFVAPARDVRAGPRQHDQRQASRVFAQDGGRAVGRSAVHDHDLVRGGSSRASDSSTARIDSPSLKTVMIRETEDEC
jgi:hypothetical protein